MDPAHTINTTNTTNKTSGNILCIISLSDIKSSSIDVVEYQACDDIHSEILRMQSSSTTHTNLPPIQPYPESLTRGSQASKRQPQKKPFPRRHRVSLAIIKVQSPVARHSGVLHRTSRARWYAQEVFARADRLPVLLRLFLPFHRRAQGDTRCCFFARGKRRAVEWQLLVGGESAPGEWY